MCIWFWVRDVDGQRFSLLNNTNKKSALYWLIQALEKKKEKTASFWAASFMSYCFFFRHHSFNNAALLYNTYKHMSNWTLIVDLVWYCICIGPKDVGLNLFAGVHVNSKQVRLRTNACVYCLTLLGPIAVTLSCKVHSLFWFWVNSIQYSFVQFFHIPFVSKRKIFNLSCIFCPTSIK